MKRSFRPIALLFALAALLFSTGPRAQEATPAMSPFAANLWAGVGLGYLDWSGTTLNSSNAKLAFSLGGDLGFRFTPDFALVALAEFAPVVSSSAVDNHYLFGGGVRLQASPMAQLLIGGGYASVSSGGGSTSGWGVRLMGFSPMSSGFGPYAQFGYDSFGSAGATLRIFSVDAGLSYSY